MKVQDYFSFTVGGGGGVKGEEQKKTQDISQWWSYIRVPKSFTQHVLGIFALFNKPCLWLAESGELSCGWGRRKNGWRYREVFHVLWREFVYLLTCGKCRRVSGTQNDIVVSWITLCGMIKVYWLDDLTLAYILDHAVCCKFRPKLASHYKPVKNKV